MSQVSLLLYPSFLEILCSKRSLKKLFNRVLLYNQMTRYVSLHQAGCSTLSECIKLNAISSSTNIYQNRHVYQIWIS